MKKGSVRFSQRLRIWFYSIFGALFFSGVFWLIAHYCIEVNDEINGDFYWIKSFLLKIHGATAMGALVILGVLVPVHMQRAWVQQRNLVTATVMIGICLSMIVSGYGLYYCGDEILRAWLSGFHSLAGCLLPLILVWHIVSGRKQGQGNHDFSRGAP